MMLPSYFYCWPVECLYWPTVISQTNLKHFMSSLKRRLRDWCIPRCALLDSSQSFQWLCCSRNDQAFIALTGLDYSSFQGLLNKFMPLYNHYSPYSNSGRIVVLSEMQIKKGRPHSLGPTDCLGLVLGCARTRGTLFALQMVFGASHSVLYLFLKYSVQLLFRVLKDEVDARVDIPSAEVTTEYQEVVRTNFPALYGSWCIMDRLKIPIEKSGNDLMQNAHYNGYFCRLCLCFCSFRGCGSLCPGCSWFMA